MDFGIKAALLTAVNVISDAARGTGRTTWALGEAERLGGVLCVVDGRERLRIRQRIRQERRTAIDVFVVSRLEHLIELQYRLGSRRAIVLDHTCHEALYREALADTDAHIRRCDQTQRSAEEFISERGGLPGASCGFAAFGLYSLRRDLTSGSFDDRAAQAFPTPYPGPFSTGGDK